MYYCVREGFANESSEEGFCKHLTVKSEMFKGQAIVDGWFKVNLDLGSNFTLKANPDYALKVLHVDLDDE